jgi:hypothetical protein
VITPVHIRFILSTTLAPPQWRVAHESECPDSG